MKRVDNANETTNCNCLLSELYYKLEEAGFPAGGKRKDIIYSFITNKGWSKDLYEDIDLILNKKFGV